LRITQQQYERIVGLAGGRIASVRPEPENVRQMLCAAAQVARRGRLQDAETMIASLPLTGPLGPATLDLKARICAQQGRLVEAQLCWMEAVRQSPGNESYRQCLQYVTHALRPPRFPLLVWSIALVVLVVMALILGYVIGRVQ
jgi:hypothetical protein